MARARRIHYTHHACLTLNATAPVPVPYSRSTGSNEPSPRWFACRGSHPTNLYSVDQAQVTCRRCIGVIADEMESRDRWLTETEEQRARRYTWGVWSTDRELVQRAWFDCCRDRGVPGHAAFVTEEEEDARRREIMRRGRRAFAELLVGGPSIARLNSPGAGDGDELRTAIVAILERVDRVAPDIHDAAWPVIDEWLMVSDLTDAIAGCMARIETLGSELIDLAECPADLPAVTPTVRRGPRRIVAPHASVL